MVGLLWVEVGTNLIHIHRYLQCIKVMVMMMMMKLLRVSDYSGLVVSTKAYYILHVSIPSVHLYSVS